MTPQLRTDNFSLRGRYSKERAREKDDRQGSPLQLQFKGIKGRRGEAPLVDKHDISTMPTTDDDEKERCLPFNVIQTAFY